MERSKLNKILLLSVLVCVSLSFSALAEGKVVWRIGVSDDNTGEFALGPDKSNLYSVTFPHGALFVAGQSDVRADWPYIQPGPADTWAGSKSHTFRIVFGLSKAVGEGECELVLDFLDTHSSKPPKLVIKVNDASFERQLPKGGGDQSAFGEIEKGREHVEIVKFDAKALKAGTNEISITSATGSWILYDSVALKVPAEVESGPLDDVTKLLGVDTQPFLLRHTDGKLYQPVLASLLHIGEPIEAAVVVDGSALVKDTLKSGLKVIEGLAPAVTKAGSVDVDINVGGETIGEKSVAIKAVRKWEIYLLHHSHVDIGYTHVQTEVIQKHFDYFEEVIELARKSADYPAGAQFKWNVEVLWAVDSYLKQASEEKREEFIEAVKKGWIALDALYGNELTALCRPEELVRLVGYAERMRREYGVKIDSAMITDVPGYTWGIVPVLAQSGVKYFSVGPNRGHRIGHTLSSWGDKPFYWQSPSGKEQVLCWVAGEGYSLFHSGRLDKGRLFKYLKQLDDSKYPYDMVHIRYSIGGDNGPPDPELSDFVKDWNEKYAYPKIIVSTASEMCREFERRYGDEIPKVAGDFTPYWEDGAGSSARETALNRDAAERLIQAEALYAMLDPKSYPADDFYEAWRNVILYDEHTWGAHCSISQPDSDFTKAQWKIKQAFALDADTQSQKLLDDSLAKHRSDDKKITAVDIFNTCSWQRTDLVALPRDWNVADVIVKDSDGNRVPTQRLSTGELAFLAEDIPPLGARRFNIERYPTKIVEQVIDGVTVYTVFYSCKHHTPDALKQLILGPHTDEDFDKRSKSIANGDYAVSGDPAANRLEVRSPIREDIEAVLEFVQEADVSTTAKKQVTFTTGGVELSNRQITLTIDGRTGAISSLKPTELSSELVSRKGEVGLNDYFYVAGRNPKEPQRNGRVKIRVKERGPAVTSLLIESDAPGCRELSREIRLIGGLDRVDIINTIDKEKVYRQEAIHLAYAFNVPDGAMRMDVPWGVVRPELDQLAGACKNYFTVQRWVDVSNDKVGVTLATVDAPLIEVGAITNDPRGGVGWIKKLEPSTTLYSYVMNNYWETNYKASQEGPTVFRYSIRPHKEFDSAEAARFGTERSQPLIPVPVDKTTEIQQSAFSVKPVDVIVTAFKPSEDGKAQIVRLYNAGTKTRKAKVTWAEPAPDTVWLSNLAEEQVSRLSGPIKMAAYEFVTLRIPLSK
ncbi:MAG: hypothetical protein ISS79_02970 [Phycisphaerae bacterium]|nr:hypothetical protein [Phycisphaerae bacterium]